MASRIADVRLRLAMGACLFAAACRTFDGADELAVDWPVSSVGAGTYESVGDSGRYRLDLSADGVFRFFVGADGCRDCAVWGRWFVNEGSLGGIGLRLLPQVPGVRPWSKCCLCLWATPDSGPTELWFDWVFCDPNWEAFQPGRSMRFVRVAG